MLLFILFFSKNIMSDMLFIFVTDLFSFLYQYWSSCTVRFFRYNILLLQLCKHYHYAMKLIKFFLFFFPQICSPFWWILFRSVFEMFEWYEKWTDNFTAKMFPCSGITAVPRQSHLGQLQGCQLETIVYWCFSLHASKSPSGRGNGFLVKFLATPCSCPYRGVIPQLLSFLQSHSQLLDLFCLIS